MLRLIPAVLLALLVSSANSAADDVTRASLAKARLVLRGPARDSVCLRLSVILPGEIDLSAGDITISLGAVKVFEVTPGDARAEFRWHGSRQTYRERASAARPGIRKLVLDRWAGRLTLKARKMDLGSLAGPEVRLTLTVGEKELTALIPLVTKGSRRIYSGPLLPLALSGGTEDIEYRLVVMGRDSLIHEAGIHIARTNAEWKALWKAHRGTGKAPPVDFGTEMVVGIFRGELEGMLVEILKVSAEGTGVRIVYRDIVDTRRYFMYPGPYAHSLIAVTKVPGPVSVVRSLE